MLQYLGMVVIFFIIFFILGLVFGSFLNCLIWRLKNKKKIWQVHSICPFCQHPLGVKDLIPLLSFFIQKGYCRYCGKKISIQYPLVELATGIIFVLIYFNWGLSYQTIFYLIISLFLFTLFIYDWRYYLIPDVLVLPAIIFAFIFNLILGHSFSNLLLAGIIVSGFFLLQFLISQGRWIGGGDIRLGFLMGVILGWPQVLVALILAYLAGALIGLFLILIKNKKWSSAIPFGTFLTAMTFFSLFYGQEILDWHLNKIWF